MDEQQIILIGTSVRAAAMSALRAGLRPWCVDLFADEDLRRVSLARRLDMARYPRGFVRALADAPAGPLVYTGGLENHPGLIERLARTRPLWGNGAPILEKVRDPDLLARRFREVNVPCPEVLPPGELPQESEVWMRKPRRGSGGLGVDVWWPARAKSGGGNAYYFQRRLIGPSYSAVYLGEKGQARLLGVTRQLVGEPWLHAGPFRYCGSIGPVALPEWELARNSYHAARLGDVLAAEFGLRGLFGVDLILRLALPYPADEILSWGVVFPVEVNPRYTASVEVLEYATGLAALALHRGAFEEDAPADSRQASNLVATSGACVGKAILFAPTALVFPTRGPWQETLAQPFDPWRLPIFADIPAAGSQIEAGQPILTFFASGADEQACIKQLQARAAELTAPLYGIQQRKET